MDKDTLIQMRNENLSSYKIGQLLNKSQTTVTYWLNKYNIPTGPIKLEGHKQCCKCRNVKTLDNFYKKTKITYQAFCKDCFNQYVMKRWIDRKLEAIKYKGEKCEDCKNKFPYPIYEFHHLDPNTKDLDWTKMRLTSLDKIKKELDKCVLLCANCHRLRHYNINLEKKGR